MNRMRELGTRLIYMEYPEALPPEIRGNLDQWRRNRLFLDDPEAKRLGIAGAIAAIDDIIAEAGEVDQDQASKIRDWLTSQKEDLPV